MPWNSSYSPEIALGDASCLVVGMYAPEETPTRFLSAYLALTDERPREGRKQIWRGQQACREIDISSRATYPPPTVEHPRVSHDCVCVISWVSWLFERFVSFFPSSRYIYCRVQKLIPRSGIEPPCYSQSYHTLPHPPLP